MNPNYAKQVKEEIDRLVKRGLHIPYGKGHLDIPHSHSPEEKHEN